ncbi:MAG: transcriptional repressor [Acidobacteria bacterium]|nr:transcriptional repressor [Acidobacteriota bacterium]
MSTTTTRDWEGELHTHARRVTKQRLAVLAVVERFPHSSAEAIAKVARETLPALTVQSVYVVLADLHTLGMVRRIEPPDSPALYETRTGDNHHHAVCTGCGRVEDVDCAVGHTPCLTPSSTTMTIRIADVLYRGLCRDCEAAQSTEATLATPNFPSPTNQR